MHGSIMSKEVDMNVETEDEPGVKSKHVDCFDAFNTSKVLNKFLLLK